MLAEGTDEFGVRCTAERYLREVWPVVTKALKEVGIGCELNLVRSYRDQILCIASSEVGFTYVQTTSAMERLLQS